jgi:tRNA (guanine-N7-)-methyltransferase
MPIQVKRLPSFARRIGRSLRDSQKNLVENLLPLIEVTEDFDINTASKSYSKIILEIGFGNGEHLAKYAIANPRTLCIGAEPYMNGVAVLLKEIHDNEIQNIRIYKDDVRNLIEKLPLKSIDQVYIICPDPWPKTKHKKRRLVNKGLLSELRKLTKESIILVTDHADYAKWMYEHAKAAEFEVFDTLHQHLNLPEDWIYTKYQRRGIKLGSGIYYFQLNINTNHL